MRSITRDPIHPGRRGHPHAAPLTRAGFSCRAQGTGSGRCRLPRVRGPGALGADL